MKKFYSILFCLLAMSSVVTFTACSNDDDEEVIEETQIDKYKKAIVGTWQLDNTKEYWRFDAQGNGSIAYGENWDEEEDKHEGEGNKFTWTIDSNGLMVIYLNNGEYNTPEPQAPFMIMSITDTKMTWVTSESTGRLQQTLTRVK